MADVFTDVKTDHMLYVINYRYATLFVTLLPLLIIYPFVQKYFVRGILIGSLKV